MLPLCENSDLETLLFHHHSPRVCCCTVNYKFAQNFLPPQVKVLFETVLVKNYGKSQSVNIITVIGKGNQLIKPRIDLIKVAQVGNRLLYVCVWCQKLWQNHSVSMIAVRGKGNQLIKPRIDFIKVARQEADFCVYVRNYGKSIVLTLTITARGKGNQLIKPRIDLIKVARQEADFCVCVRNYGKIIV